VPPPPDPVHFSGNPAGPDSLHRRKRPPKSGPPHRNDHREAARLTRRLKPQSPSREELDLAGNKPAPCSGTHTRSAHDWPAIRPAPAFRFAASESVQGRRAESGWTPVNSGHAHPREGAAPGATSSCSITWIFPAKGGRQDLPQFGCQLGVQEFAQNHPDGEAAPPAALVLHHPPPLLRCGPHFLHVREAARSGVAGGDDESGIAVPRYLAVRVLHDGGHASLLVQRLPLPPYQSTPRLLRLLLCVLRTARLGCFVLVGSTPRLPCHFTVKSETELA